METNCVAAWRQTVLLHGDKLCRYMESSCVVALHDSGQCLGSVGWEHAPSCAVWSVGTKLCRLRRALRGVNTRASTHRAELGPRHVLSLCGCPFSFTAGSTSSRSKPATTATNEQKTWILRARKKSYSHQRYIMYIYIYTPLVPAQIPMIYISDMLNCTDSSCLVWRNYKFTWTNNTMRHSSPFA